MANIEGGRSTAEHSMGTMWSPCTFAFVLCSKEGVAVGTGAGREALDRVDAILRKLAEDKFLQDDLRHPDVKKALEHWTGLKRLSDDEADELMEDNYRIQAVFSKVSELQNHCKAAGINMPLAQLLSRKGLYTEGAMENKPLASNSTNASTSASTTDPEASSLAHADAPGKRRDAESIRREHPVVPNSSEARSSAGPPGEDGGGGGGGTAVRGAKEPEEMTWKQAVLEELWRIAIVCLFSAVFSLGLRYYRGGREDLLSGVSPETTDGQAVPGVMEEL